VHAKQIKGDVGDLFRECEQRLGNRHRRANHNQLALDSPGDAQPHSRFRHRLHRPAQISATWR
jgi:hypothetical protein